MKKEEKLSPKIIVTLHHNYLAIEREKGKFTEKIDLQLPIRIAKLIKDMYNLRNADNETDDLLHYSNDGYNNPEYELNVFVMNAEFHSDLQWVSKNIKPFSQQDLNKYKKKRYGK